MSAREFGSRCIIRPHLQMRRGKYPILRIRHENVRVQQSAARIVYQMYIGEVNRWQLVSHRCGNIACLNPNHLCLRSRADVATDVGARRRLSPQDVWYIRRSQRGVRQLSRWFNYSCGSLSRIRHHEVGQIERFSIRYALLILWERITMKGDRRG